MRKKLLDRKCGRRRGDSNDVCNAAREEDESTAFRARWGQQEYATPEYHCSHSLEGQSKKHPGGSAHQAKPWQH